MFVPSSEDSRSSKLADAPISDFRISEATVEKLKEKNVHTLFPIQAKTFDLIYDGQDVIGRARTGTELLRVRVRVDSRLTRAGTGKTLSYVIPIVERMFQGDKKRAFGRLPRVICMCPTRELAIQVSY